MVRLIEDHSAIIMFADEAVFSTRQTARPIWAAADPPQEMFTQRNKMSFNAIACVAAIDREGKLCAILTHEYSIKSAEFAAFLRQIR